MSSNYNSSSTPSSEMMLDFASTMSDFKSMFPNIHSSTIERILRKHEGDVTNTINELLLISEESEATFSSATTSNPITNQNNVEKNDCSMQHQMLPVRERTNPDCGNDEKIALLMQNQEFLRYLQRDDNFMREIGQAPPPQYSNGYRSWRYARPNYNCRTLPPAYVTTTQQPIFFMSQNGAWRQHTPPPRDYYRQYSYLNSYGSIDNNSYREYANNTFKTSDDSCLREHNLKDKTDTLPSGPLVDFSEGSVPNGPYLDYPASSSHNWKQKLKSHLPLINKSTKHQQLNSTEADEPLHEENSMKFIDYSSTNDFTYRLRNMNKNSKMLFLALAKKFSLSKKSSSIPMRSNAVEEPNSDYGYDQKFDDSMTSFPDYDSKKKRSASSIR